MTGNLPTINIEQLYRKPSLLKDARNSVDRLKQCYNGLFGYSSQVRIFTAPGRTEIGGNHTDHQQGCVLAAAVSLDA